MSNEKMISVREFRMWLQGVEEMQSEDWVPSSQQWAKIRSKIDNIADTPTHQASLPPVVFPQRQIEPTILTAPTPNTMPVQQAGPSSLMVPQQRPVLNPLLSSGAGNIKTPDIDTSAKSYESGFV